MVSNYYFLATSKKKRVQKLSNYIICTTINTLLPLTFQVTDYIYTKIIPRGNKCVLAYLDFSFCIINRAMLGIVYSIIENSLHLFKYTYSIVRLFHT